MNNTAATRFFAGFLDPSPPPLPHTTEALRRCGARTCGRSGRRSSAGALEGAEQSRARVFFSPLWAPHGRPQHKRGGGGGGRARASSNAQKGQGQPLVGSTAVNNPVARLCGAVREGVEGYEVVCGGAGGSRGSEQLLGRCVGYWSVGGDGGRGGNVCVVAQELCSCSLLCSTPIRPYPHFTRLPQHSPELVFVCVCERENVRSPELSWHPAFTLLEIENYRKTQGFCTSSQYKFIKE